jgi:GntR family transcriptional repressor for pyruvate dehydrogenase complex
MKPSILTEYAPMPAPARRPRNLAQALVADLSERIRGGMLAPGDKLPTESEVMLAYGVSRAVVREAITHLQAARLVETRHGIGTFVLPPPEPGLPGIDPATVLTLKDVLAVLELRVSLETEVASLAAQRRTAPQLEALRTALDRLHACRAAGQPTAEADADFHLAIALGANNLRFHEILQHLGSHIIPRSRLSLARLTPEDLQRVAREHEDVFHAIRRQDAETARAAMRSHLSNSRERLLRSQTPDMAANA